MTVRTKFKVGSITRMMGSSGEWVNGEHVFNQVELQTVKLYPVNSRDKNSENAKFFASTPSGSIELGTVKLAAGFDLNKEYYVDFTPAE